MLRQWHAKGSNGSPSRPRPALVTVPLLLIAAIAVVDILLAPALHVAPLLVVAPAVTVAFGGPLLIAAIGALAVVVLILHALYQEGTPTANDETQVIGLLAITVFLVLFRRVHERHQEDLRKAQMVTEATRNILVAPLPPRLGPLRIATLYVAAEAAARIGGDLYAVVRTPHGTRVMIGDVRGKGLPAVRAASLCLGAFRAAAHRGLPLPTLVEQLDEAMRWEATQLLPPEEAGEGFITAAILDVLDDEPLLQLVTCGHPPPLLLHRGNVTPLSARDPALPLGMGEGLLRSEYETETFP
ncbi:putative serine/threonine-protein phosphatase [Streptomyces sp. NBRC 110611]|nr:putative serine/threonine-protein phosphatase [Streptomyces sp. NBRC 110611]